MAISEDNTPIIIGVGQVTQRVPEDIQKASSPFELAAQAANLAIDDAAADSVRETIDTLAMVRMFADSSPSYTHPFGSSNNPPQTVANKIGCTPEHTIYSSVGGHMPQTLVNEFAHKLSIGANKLVLLVGAEALATQRAAKRAEKTLDWSDKVDTEFEDRGMSTDNLITTHEVAHQMAFPMEYYALMENARRAAKEMSREDYRHEMGSRFSPISKVASTNPHAFDQRGYDTEALIEPTKNNPLVVEPYTKNLMAKDSVNQAAALIMTTVGQAKILGIDSTKWIYLHASVDASDSFLLERPKLHSSQALAKAICQALSDANKTHEQIHRFDLYSCFPIVVSESCELLKIGLDDPRPITQTGGLPYFGGPGNNYSMHAIVSMVENLRENADEFGMVIANGGWMSKFSIGIYSAQKSEDTACRKVLTVDSKERVATEPRPDGEALIESYAYQLDGEQIKRAMVIGKMKSTGKRFYATVPPQDKDTLEQLSENDSIGQSIFVEYDPRGNRFAFDEHRVKTFTPKTVNTFQSEYEHCLIEIEGPVLRVTINRPKIGNALHPPANEELVGIFNAYEQDPDLRVAILTGAGDRYFCTGNDLKYMASGKHVYIPEEGFAGITTRQQRMKPIIAQVNGIAVGGGLEIALAADMIVAVDHAMFALPEIHVGLFAGAGGIQRLTRQIGHKAAMEILLTGNPVMANDALAMGLINYAVPADKLANKTDQLAQQISHASPEAIRATMSVYHQTAHLASIDAAVTANHNAFDALLNGSDFWEGPKAFLEKRQANWIPKS